MIFYYAMKVLIFNSKDESMNAKVFILDVDGVMTTGQFLYSRDGKVMKVLALTIMMHLLC